MTRTVVVGIDEAGYGPILGPLVVSAAAFDVPQAVADRSLWDVLAGSVARIAHPRDGRIAILDSKKLYKPQEGLSRLERSFLAIVEAWRGRPPTLRGLLGLVAPEALAALGEYPWYRGSDPALPRQADAGSVRLAAACLRRNLAARGLAVAGLWAEVLLEGHYNRLVDTTRNKSVVLSGLTLRLIQRVAQQWGERTLVILIDKQGGRERYAPLLLRAFDGRRLRVLEESADASAYELLAGPSRWHLTFRQGGEDEALPTALASMLSKYVRELLMECFNSYWTGRVPLLKPTAGYYRDGLRFLRQIRPHVAAAGVREELLVRKR